MINLNSLARVLLLLCLPSASLAQGADETLAFARLLHAEGEYYRAITEYKRVLYLAPDESTMIRETAILGIGGALFSGSEYGRSAEWVHAHLTNLRAGEKRMEGFRLMCRGFLADNAGSRLLTVIHELGDSIPETRIYEGLAHANIGHWREAATVFQSLNENESLGPMACRFATFAQEGERAAWKSPRAACVLGIVPGLGYWYAGHRQTAVASLLVNALFVGATVVAFQSDQDLLGGFMSLFTVSWYAGNVYGSSLAARRYNDNLHDEIWGRFEY